MTFILSQFNDVTKLLALSDTLISVPADVNPAPIALPFREDPLSLSSAGYSPASFAQKMVIAGRTMMLWAGRRVIARELIQQVIKASNGGEEALTLESVLSCYGEDQNDLNEIAFIYHHDYFGENPTRISWGCEEHRAGDLNLRLGGSGAWHFMENIDFTPGNQRFAEGAVLPHLIGKTMMHAVMEHASTTSLEFLYGGWFELLYPYSKYVEKLPYAVKFWYKEAGDLAEGPLLFGWYAGDDLCISTVRVVDGVESRSDVWIKDLLDRERRKPQLPIIPAFINNIVVESGSLNFVSYLEPYTLISNDMMVVLDASGISSWFRRTFRKKLRAMEGGNYGIARAGVL